MAKQRSTFPLRASRAAWSACGVRVQHTSYPGGKSRDSIRLHLGDGRTIIATRRHDKERADREVEVLKGLHRAGAPVPQILAYDGDILLQQDIGERRLSQAVFEAEPQAVAEILNRALESLAVLQHAGMSSQIVAQLPVLGGDAAWIKDVVETPLRLARFFDLAEPVVDWTALAEAITMHTPSFVKWDARLGNAAFAPDGRIYWFDFEHCGARNALDDVGWMLGDEYLPDIPEIEERIFADRLMEFRRAGDARPPEVYLANFGTLHIATRLAVMLSRHNEVGWVDANDAVARDKIGACRHLAIAVAHRAARWARRSSHLAAAAPAFEAMADAIDAMP